jgi:hypothetical protein
MIIQQFVLLTFLLEFSGFPFKYITCLKVTAGLYLKHVGDKNAQSQNFKEKYLTEQLMQFLFSCVYKQTIIKIIYFSVPGK